MFDRLRIYYYFIKDLDPDYQRHIMGEMTDLKNHYDDEKVLNTENYKLKWELNDEQMNFFLENIYWKYENINRYLIKHQRHPFFNTNDLKECIKVRDEYNKLISKEECMNKYNVPRFEDYVPRIYENDLLNVIELYTENKNIIKALQTRMENKNNFLSGFCSNNVYQYINWMLAYEGKMPLFNDINNKEECEKRRKKLIEFIPKNECLKYFDIEKEEDIIKYQCNKKILKIEKYITCYGEDPSNTSWRYHIGWRIRYIVDSNKSIEDKVRYLKEINNINGKIIFNNPDNLDECMNFIKDNLIFVED